MSPAGPLCFLWSDEEETRFPRAGRRHVVWSASRRAKGNQGIVFLPATRQATSCMVCLSERKGGNKLHLVRSCDQAG